jgi:pyrimidine deaminase RibD-like protein
LNEKEYSDRDFMEMAIEESEKSQSGPCDPKVGVVIAQNKQLIAKAYRGESGPGVHAEVSGLNKISANPRNDLATGCTVFTTLEPCTTRNRYLQPCASALISRGVKRVVIGMLDPNKDIRGQGEWQLEDARITIGKFDADLLNFA